jgi:hypothetical protein
MNTPELNKAIALAKLEFPKILANRTVSVGKYSFTYAELEEITAAITPILSTNQLVLISQIRQNGTQLILITSIRHSSGEFVESHYPLPSEFADPKQLGAAISYGRRYNTMCLLEISTIEPSDSNAIAEQQRKMAADLRKEIKQIPEIPAQINSQNLQTATKTYDRNLINSEIESVMKRKKIAASEAQSILLEKFGRKSRTEVTDENLQKFLEILQLRPISPVAAS